MFLEPAAREVGEFGRGPVALGEHGLDAKLGRPRVGAKWGGIAAEGADGAPECGFIGGEQCGERGLAGGGQARRGEWGGQDVAPFVGDGRGRLRLAAEPVEMAGGLEGAHAFGDLGVDPAGVELRILGTFHEQPVLFRRQRRGGGDEARLLAAVEREHPLALGGRVEEEDETARGAVGDHGVGPEAEEARGGVVENALRTEVEQFVAGEAAEAFALLGAFVLHGLEPGRAVDRVLEGAAGHGHAAEVEQLGDRGREAVRGVGDGDVGHQQRPVGVFGTRCGGEAVDANRHAVGRVEGDVDTGGRERRAEREHEVVALELDGERGGRGSEGGGEEIDLLETVVRAGRERGRAVEPAGQQVGERGERRGQRTLRGAEQELEARGRIEREQCLHLRLETELHGAEKVTLARGDAAEGRRGVGGAEEVEHEGLGEFPGGDGRQRGQRFRSRRERADEREVAVLVRSVVEMQRRLFEVLAPDEEDQPAGARLAGVDEQRRIAGQEERLGVEHRDGRGRMLGAVVPAQEEVVRHVGDQVRRHGGDGAALELAGGDPVGWVRGALVGNDDLLRGKDVGEREVQFDETVADRRLDAVQAGIQADLRDGDLDGIVARGGLEFHPVVLERGGRAGCGGGAVGGCAGLGGGLRRSGHGGVFAGRLRVQRGGEAADAEGLGDGRQGQGKETVAAVEVGLAARVGFLDEHLDGEFLGGVRRLSEALLERGEGAGERLGAGADHVFAARERGSVDEGLLVGLVDHADPERAHVELLEAGQQPLEELAVVIVDGEGGVGDEEQVAIARGDRGEGIMGDLGGFEGGGETVGDDGGERAQQAVGIGGGDLYDVDVAGEGDELHDAAARQAAEELAQQVLGGLDAVAAGRVGRVHVHRAADVEHDGDDRGVARRDLGGATVGDAVVAVDQSADTVEDVLDALGLGAEVGAAGVGGEALERLLVGLLAVGDGEERRGRVLHGGEDLLLVGAAAVAGIVDAAVEAVGEDDERAAAVAGALGQSAQDGVVEFGAAVGLDLADGGEQRGAVGAGQVADLGVEIDELDRALGRQVFDETQRGGLRLREDLPHRERRVERHHDMELCRYRIDGDNLSRGAALDQPHGCGRGRLGKHRRGDEHAAERAVGRGLAQLKLVEPAQLLALECPHLRPGDDRLAPAGDGDERGLERVGGRLGVGGGGAMERPEAGGQAEDGVALRRQVGHGLGVVEERMAQIGLGFGTGRERGLADVAHDERARRFGPADRRRGALVLDSDGERARRLAVEGELESPGRRELGQQVEELRERAFAAVLPLQRAADLVFAELGLRLCDEHELGGGIGGGETQAEEAAGVVGEGQLQLGCLGGERELERPAAFDRGGGGGLAPDGEGGGEHGHKNECRREEPGKAHGRSGL